LLTLCCLTIVGMTQSKRSAAEDKAMTAGDLQQICIDSSAESKAGCRFYLLGITQGISMGMVIADGKTQGGASLCSGQSFRLGYRASGQNETGRGFDGVSRRPQAGRIRSRRCYPRFDFPMPQAKLAIQSSRCGAQRGNRYETREATLTPDKSGYRQSSFARFHFSDLRVYQVLDESPRESS
jgi:hypothetical protein